MNNIELNKLTDYEQAFVKAALEDFNDLMFTDDLKHGIPTASLGGVVSSLVKKGIIDVFGSPAINGSGERFIGEFQFTSQRDDTWNKPTLV